MTQGLFASVSGILVNQSRLDVIADNIANVSTVGFKASLVNFETLFARTLRSGSASSGSLGGVNPMQVGLGTRVAEVSRKFTNGNIVQTARPSDLNIQGNGFFVVDKGSTTGNAGALAYTRAGNFTTDSNGNVVTPNGYRVLGTSRLTNTSASSTPLFIPQSLNIVKTADVNGSITTATLTATDPTTPSNNDVIIDSFQVQTDGAVVVNYANGDKLTVETLPGSDPATREVIFLPSEGTGTGNGLSITTGLTLTPATLILPANLQVQFALFPNPMGLTSEGGNIFTAVGLNSGTPSYSIARSNGIGVLDSGALETSNVDMANELTQMILAQRALEASSRMVSTTNEVLENIVNMAR